MGGSKKKYRNSNVKGDFPESGIRSYVYYNNGNIKTIKDYRKFLQGTNEYINKSYSYDVFDRVTSITISDSGNLNTILESHTYTYDKNSNIISEGIINNYPSNQSEKVNETRLYTYDNLNRLKTSNNFVFHYRIQNFEPIYLTHYTYWLL